MKKSLERSWRDLSFYLSPRYILGIILICASFLSAFAITQRADRTITVWSATVDLAPGTEITSESIAPIRVRLPENAEQYLSTEAEIVGASVLRGIGASELIPSFALATELDPDLQHLPISISIDRVPSGLRPGSSVDIYTLPNQNLQSMREVPMRSKLLLSRVVIETIDDSGRDLGGNLLMTLLINQQLVPEVIAAMSNSEFILVRRMIQE